MHHLVDSLAAEQTFAADEKFPGLAEMLAILLFEGTKSNTVTPEMRFLHKGIDYKYCEEDIKSVSYCCQTNQFHEISSISSV